MGKLANLNNVVGSGRSLETVKSRYQERLAEFCVNRATTNRCSIVRQRIDSPSLARIGNLEPQFNYRLVK
jgi:hypothetical protein